MIQPLRTCDLGAGTADDRSEGDCTAGAFAEAAGGGSAAAVRAGNAAVARGAGAAGGSTCAAAADGKTGCAASAGSVAGSEETSSGAGEAVCVPALTVSVFTSTGRIGSVEPMAMLGDAEAFT